MKKAFVLLLTILLIATVCYADVTETVTFQWEDPNAPGRVKDFRIYWSETAGGPYDQTPVAIIAYGSGPPFESPADVLVTGAPTTTVTKFFVMVACEDQLQADGSTDYVCSGNSNEISKGFFIPAELLEIPINFQIKAVP